MSDEAPSELSVTEGNSEDEENSDNGAEFPETSPLLSDAPDPFIPMNFVDVVMVLPSTHPVVILEEMDEPHRQLRIPVGTAEGVAIGYAARYIDTPKPLTHELFLDMMVAFGITIEVVRITEVKGSAYSAEMIVSSRSGLRTFRCRFSDALALILRQGTAAPITASPEVLDQVGFASS